MKYEEMIERGFTSDSNGKILDGFGNEYRNEDGKVEYLEDQVVLMEKIRKIKETDIPYAACDHPGCHLGAQWQIWDGTRWVSRCYTHTEELGWWIDSGDMPHAIISEVDNMQLVDDEYLMDR